MNRRFRPIVLLVSCGLLASLSGCGVFSGDSKSDGRRDPVRAGIPTAARVVEEGSGPIDYKAADDGTVYVQDARTKATIVSKHVDRGDRVRVEFDPDRVRVGDTTVYDGNLERDNAHRIYFQSDRGTDDRDRDRTSRLDRVPTSATLVGEGRDEELTYRATKSGTIYVYDADEKEVVGTAGIRDGQRFTLTPSRGRATLDDNRVDVGTLSDRKNYRVYFDRD